MKLLLSFKYGVPTLRSLSCRSCLILLPFQINWRFLFVLAFDYSLPRSRRFERNEGKWMHCFVSFFEFLGRPVFILLYTGLPHFSRVAFTARCFFKAPALILDEFIHVRGKMRQWTLRSATLTMTFDKIG